MVVAIACAGSAQAATINVKPKPDALEKAIEKAKKGDTLKVKGGVYREVVRVTKPLKIVGEKGDRPTITGHCDVGILIDVQSRGVTLANLG